MPLPFQGLRDPGSLPGAPRFALHPWLLYRRAFGAWNVISPGFFAQVFLLYLFKRQRSGRPPVDVRHSILLRQRRGNQRLAALCHNL
jgi:hypothetical protein